MTTQLQYRSEPGAGLTRVRVNRRRRRVLLALFVGMETPGAFSLGRLAQVGPGSVYPFLAHLERAGWVTSEWETVPPGEDRPRRRFYTLTSLGRTEGGRLLGLVSTPYAYCGPVSHDWQPDPDRKSEGLCGMTEAELDAMEHDISYDGDVPF